MHAQAQSMYINATKLTTATELYTRLQTTANKSATLAMLTASLYCQQTQSENSENNFSSYTILVPSQCLVQRPN